MKARVSVLTVLALLIIGTGWWVVGQISSRQVLDAPGVRVSNVPLVGEEGRLVRTNSVAMPPQLPGYRYQAEPVSDIELASLPADTVFGRARYVPANGPWAQVNVVLMGTDRTSIHRPEYCLTGVGWKVLSQRTLPFEGQGRMVPKEVQRFDCRLRTQIDGQLVDIAGVYVFWFVSRDKQTSSHWQRQWWMVRDLVTRGVLQRWAYISFFMPCTPGTEDAAYERLSQLIRETSPYFEVTSDVVSQ